MEALRKLHEAYNRIVRGLEAQYENVVWASRRELDGAVEGTGELQIQNAVLVNKPSLYVNSS